MGSYQVTSGYECKSYVVSNTSVGIDAAGWSWTAGNLALAERCVITARSAPIMVRWDGGDPTATLGHYIAADSTLELTGGLNVNNVHLIRASGSDSTVSISLEK